MVFKIVGLYAVLDKLKLFESSESAEFLAEFYAETDLEPIGSKVRKPSYL